MLAILGFTCLTFLAVAASSVFLVWWYIINGPAENALYTLIWGFMSGSGASGLAIVIRFIWSKNYAET